VTEAGAFAAWLGGSIIVLADGRRGLAVGLALVAAGLAGLELSGGRILPAAALAAGGTVAAVLRFRSGPAGWGLMQPGSTPRMILAVVAGLLALWIGASVATGDGASLRVAVLASVALMAARILQGGEPAVALTAAGGLALALGAGAGIEPQGPVLAACIVAAVIAAGASAMPDVEPHGA